MEAEDIVKRVVRRFPRPEWREDLEQVARIAVWKTDPRFAYIAACRDCIDFLRTVDRVAARKLPEGWDVEDPDPAEPEVKSEWLASLSKTDRQLVWLRISGNTLEEVATAIGKTVRQVQYRLDQLKEEYRDAGTDR